MGSHLVSSLSVLKRTGDPPVDRCQALAEVLQGVIGQATGMAEPARRFHAPTGV